MNKNELKQTLQMIRDEFAKNGDEAIVRKYAGYFKEGYDAYGVGVTKYNALKVKWFGALSEELDVKGFQDVCDTLMESAKYEEKSLAIDWMLNFRKQYSHEMFLRMTAWLDDRINNWAHCDYFCTIPMKHFILQGIVTIDDCSDWRTMPSKWRRRAAAVSQLIYLRNNADTRKHAAMLRKVSVQTLLDFVEPILHDTERVVHQGVGWLLRECWKVDPKPVEQFLLKHRATAPRLIYQYATEKMTAEQKEQFRRDKPQKSRVKR